MTAVGSGTAEDPWVLHTPPGTSEYRMHRDESADPPALVCVVGTTTLTYQLRCLDDLHAMLRSAGDWVPVGSADEQKPAKDGTVEAWARSESNPVRGLVRATQGLPRPIRHVHPAADEGPGLGRTGAQPAQQPDARVVTRCTVMFVTHTPAPLA